MHRAHIVWLAALATLLMSDGSRSAHEPAAAPAAVTLDRLSEAQVSAYLRHLNPELSPGQDERIAVAVVKYSGKYALDTSLVLAVIYQESSGRPWVRSEKGAVGLMQVMPHMLGSLGLAGNLANIDTNIEAGCIILADNIRRLGEDRGILAYFWGNNIRGAAYLDEVRAARAAIRRRVAAS
ncbi:MAG: lytic transglycosylase domain-containing protein [Deltaproteobacteria bacterium]|nr:lytic transglycosylase domain-containing protein [Deltaproteobacteria bacterium]MBW2360239.1 lytic transglycosylase domain-containing protein [Deltaproteobacteria bacterium]